MSDVQDYTVIGNVVAAAAAADYLQQHAAVLRMSSVHSAPDGRLDACDCSQRSAKLTPLWTFGVKKIRNRKKIIA